MYNEEIKKRYIIEKESTTCTPKDYLSRQFNKIEEFEIRLNKDISCFTVYEIVDLYKTLNFASIESLTVLNSHFALYTDWCLRQNMVPDCQNHFMEITPDVVRSCVNTIALKKSIVTRETLYKWFNELQNPSDAFIMLALFEGIKGKEFCEIVNLKMSDFSGNKVKLCTGRELIVSDKLVELAKKTDETLEYYAVKAGSLKTYRLEDEGYIIKNFHNCESAVSDFQRGRRIYTKLIRSFEYLGVAEWMKPNSLVESGKIEYINTRSKELGITGKEFIYSEYASEIMHRYEYNMPRLRAPYYSKFGEYLT